MCLCLLFREKRGKFRKDTGSSLKTAGSTQGHMLSKKFLAEAAQEVINYEGVSPATWNRIHIAEKC